MTRSEIKELALQLTERKTEKQIDTDSLFRFVVQDICKRQRFWWRRVVTSFNVVANTPNYDMSDTTIFPDLKELAVEEITKLTIVTSASPLQTAELTPIFDPEAVLEMKQQTTQVQPTRYSIDTLSNTKILLDHPDINYTAWLVGWVMPNPASQTTTDSVPLIPTWGHNVIVSGLMVKMFEYAYGSRNEKTVDALREYEMGLQDLMSKKQFDPNYRSQLSLAEDAVRST